MSYQRKFHILFPKFQLSLLSINVGSLIISSFILWVQIRMIFDDLRVVAGTRTVDVEYFRKYLVYQADRLESSLWISALVGLTICIVSSLFISNKFVGPLVNIKRFFNTVASGVKPTPRISFRDGDTLYEIPEIINIALDVVENKVPPMTAEKIQSMKGQ